MAKENKVKIGDLIPDDKNFNKGKAFGNSLIEKSLRQFGAGRSILLDKNNRIIAGNKTVENAGAIGLENVRIIETTGDEIIAVKRIDVDLDSKTGRELALADNATSKANLEWDFEAINSVFDEQEAKDWGVVEWDEVNVEVETQTEANTPMGNNDYKITITCVDHEQQSELSSEIKRLCAKYSDCTVSVS